LGGQVEKEKAGKDSKMSDPAEKNLTEEGTSSIIVSGKERRILTNLRRLSKNYPDGEYAVLFKNYRGQLQYGTACHKDITERI